MTSTGIRPPAAHASSPYRHLRERAFRLLATSGGGLSARDLAVGLLGASSGSVSDQIVASILVGDHRFERVPDGWRLAAAKGVACVADEVVTIAIATTGADPARHRIVRLAVVRAGPRGIVGRFDVVTRHDRRPARYLLDAARLTLDDLDQAPTFADVVPELDTMIGDHDLHAYAAGWVGAFVDAERARAGLAPLPNRYVEIDGLGADLVPVGQKPGLAALANALGIAHGKPGLPMADAEVAANVVLRLAGRGATSGPTRPVQALADESRADPGSSPRERTDEARPVRVESSARPLVSREWLATVSSGPGVYLMGDVDGLVLYVGKAANLRRRLATYARRAPALDRRLEGLAARATRVTVLETESDLEATLLEARLLTQHSPLFNVARRVHGAASYIRVALADDPPRVHLVRDAAADGARYVGPLRSARQAQQAVAVARQAFPAAFGRKVADAQARRRAVLDVAALLGGQKDGALAAVREQMRAAADAGDREVVDRARATLRRVHDLKLEPSLLIGLGGGGPLLIVEAVGDGERLRGHLVTAGGHVGATDLDTSSGQDRPDEIRAAADAIIAAPRPSASDGTPPSDVDEQTVIMRWLAMSRSVVGVYRVPS